MYRHQLLSTGTTISINDCRSWSVRTNCWWWVVGWELFAFIVKYATRAMPRRSRTRSLALIDFSPHVCIIATSPVVCAKREKLQNAFRRTCPLEKVG
jgi:hypothetical protein